MLRNLDFKVVVIGGSAGSFGIVSNLLSQLKPGFKIPIVLCLHRLKQIDGGFEDALNIKSKLDIRDVRDKEYIKNGRIYLAPANYHTLIDLNKSFVLSSDCSVNYSRPCIDITFDSFSYVYQSKMLGIILSGANSDGAKGMYVSQKRGAYTIVQDPNDAPVRTMVESTLKLFNPNLILSKNKIIEVINSIKSN
jgi:two-component system, chemotaxis family, protein-glutamate methylesterase/glutaminase